MKSLLNLRCHVLLTHQLRKTCTTHTQTQDWTIHFDWCSQSVTLLFTAKSTNTAQTYPSITLAAAYPKPKEVHYKIKLQRSNATKSTSRNLCPSPMATTYCHRSSQDRPHTTRFSGACICHLISYFQKTVHFFGSVYQKITTNYFVIFWIDLEDLSGIYLNRNITTNIYVVF